MGTSEGIEPRRHRQPGSPEGAAHGRKRPDLHSRRSIRETCHAVCALSHVTGAYSVPVPDGRSVALAASRERVGKYGAVVR